jgi:hypothetical protein
MADVPGDAGQDSEKKPNDETKPKATEKNSEPEADNTAEIIGTAVGGILTALAGIVGVAGLSLWALWFGFFALCCYLVSFGSWLHEHSGLPARPLRFVTALLLLALLTLCVYLHGVIRAHDAEEARKDSQLNAVEKSAADTARRIAEQQRRRRLTEPQKAEIKEAIAPYAGQKIKILYPMNDGEASQYAQDFAAVFRDAGWKCDDIRGWFFATEFDNVLVAASNKLPAPVRPPKATSSLVSVLMKLGLTKNRGMDPLRMVNQSNDIAEDELLLRVEAKMPPEEPAAE